jgi:two-component system sensor histidine kinase RegB
MSSRSHPIRQEPAADPHDVHRVLINMQWISRLRWVAIAGQALTIIVAQWLLGLVLPLPWLLLILVITALTNAAMVIWLRGQWLLVPDPQALRQGQATLAAVMLLDMVSLTMLLYLTGGTANPFCVFYLVNFALAAMVLSELWTWAVVAIGVLGLAVLTFEYLPIDALPAAAEGRGVASPEGGWVRGSGPPGLAQAGMAVGVGLCGVVVVYFVRRLSAALQQSETRRRQAEQQRARSERLEALGTLAAGAGHELNTPLSTIAVVSKELTRELAERDDLPNSIGQDVKLIRSEVERCRNILNRLSLDSGRSAGEPLVEATVAQLIDEVLSELRAAARVDVSADADTNARTLFVPLVSLAQALRALLQNAVDVTPGEQPVQLRTTIDNGQLLWQVEDHGPGMSAAVQTRAFEPFFTTKAVGEGMGLGLFLAQNTIQRLGGRIELTSAAGQGSRVDVWLPLA